MKGQWILLIILLCWAIIATTFASYYYVENEKYYRTSQDLKRKLEEVSISVNIGIDYGNGTRIWFNETIMPVGVTVFNATASVANLEPHPTYGESFIIAINGVRQNENENLYWIWWIWDEAQHVWVPGPVACTEYVLNDGQTIFWYYENTLSWPPPSP